MNNNRCFGLTRTFHRCSREGEWRIFCVEHNRQWIGWVFTFVFTVVAGAASIYSVAPSFLPKSPPTISISGSNNIERAISMAKMEGVKFNTPSATEVVAKFYVRPMATYPIHKDMAIFALVSVSPFKPLNSESTFDAGDCRFLGHVTAFDPTSNKAVLSVKTISCTDNANQAFALENEDYELKPNGLLADLDAPTENSITLTKESDGTYSVPMFNNALLKFYRPIAGLKKIGRSFERF